MNRYSCSISDIKKNHEAQILDEIRKLYFSTTEKEYIENFEIARKAISEISPNMMHYLLRTWLEPMQRVHLKGLSFHAAENVNESNNIFWTFDA
jgi:hypothetical protein